MGLLYLSGPITGTSDYIARFARAQTRMEHNWDVINPAAVIYQLPPLHYETIMKIDLQLLDICDAIYMMAGWRDSHGAWREYQYAKEQKLILLFESEEDRNEYRNNDGQAY